MTDQPTVAPVPPVAPPYVAPATVLRQTNTMALVSLISGILGWTLLPWIGSIAAIVTGHMARAEIRRNPETQDGDGLAIGGLVLGWAMVGLSILGILMVVLFLGGIAALIAGLGLSGQLH